MVANLIPKELNEAFLDKAIQEPNFFNGRMLTAGDMVALQKAVHQRDQRLGSGLGSGVVYGLEVRLAADGSNGKPPVLAVSEGLAFNQQGMAVSLPQNIEVKLEKEKSDPTPDSGFFDFCQPPQANGKPLPGKGIYLFVVRPAAAYRGLAPRRGFGQATKVEGCDYDLMVEGVQFRFVNFDIEDLDNVSEETRAGLKDLLQDIELDGQTGLAAQNKFRNWMAHVCFGTEELSRFVEDPFARRNGVSPFEAYGAVDKLREVGSIDDCDVPLALVCWTVTGVKWIDVWSVRRKLVRSPLSEGWPIPGSDRRAAEAEAIFQQFQAHIKDLRIDPFTTITTRARDRFRYLPAAGLVPLSRSTTQRGFNERNFFDQMTARGVVQDVTTSPIVIEGARVPRLLNESFHYPPLDIDSGVMVWVYHVRENLQVPDALPYVVFTSGHIPYIGNAQFNVSRWSLSNFAR